MRVARATARSVLLPQRSLALRKAKTFKNKDDQHAGYLLHGESPNAWGAFQKWTRRWFYVTNDCLCWRKTQESFEMLGAVPLCFVRDLYRCDNVKGEKKYEDCNIAVDTDWMTVALVADDPASTNMWHRHLAEAWETATAPKPWYDNAVGGPDDGENSDELPLDAQQATAYEQQIETITAECDVLSANLAHTTQRLTHTSFSASKWRRVSWRMSARVHLMLLAHGNLQRSARDLARRVAGATDEAQELRDELTISRQMLADRKAANTAASALNDTAGRLAEALSSVNSGRTIEGELIRKLAETDAGSVRYAEVLDFGPRESPINIHKLTREGERASELHRRGRKLVTTLNSDVKDDIARRERGSANKQMKEKLIEVHKEYAKTVATLRNSNVHLSQEVGTLRKRVTAAAASPAAAPPPDAYVKIRVYVSEHAPECAVGAIRVPAGGVLGDVKHAINHELLTEYANESPFAYAISLNGSDPTGPRADTTPLVGMLVGVGSEDHRAVVIPRGQEVVYKL